MACWLGGEDLLEIMKGRSEETGEEEGSKKEVGGCMRRTNGGKKQCGLCLGTKAR